jgi:hypothetical protein
MGQREAVSPEEREEVPLEPAQHDMGIAGCDGEQSGALLRLRVALESLLDVRAGDVVPYVSLMNRSCELVERQH